MLIVAPGSFRTEGVHAYPATINTRIPAYEAARTAGMARFEGIAGKERGDPAKAMELLDAVCETNGQLFGEELRSSEQGTYSRLACNWQCVSPGSVTHLATGSRQTAPSGGATRQLRGSWHSA